MAFYLQLKIDFFIAHSDMCGQSLLTWMEHVNKITDIWIIDQFCTYELLSIKSAKSRASELRECDWYWSIPFIFRSTVPIVVYTIISFINKQVDGNKKYKNLCSSVGFYRVKKVKLFSKKHVDENLIYREILHIQLQPFNFLCIFRPLVIFDDGDINVDQFAGETWKLIIQANGIIATGRRGLWIVRGWQPFVCFN